VNTFVEGTYTVASGHHDAIGMLGGSGVVEIGLDASLSIGGNNTSSDPVHFPNSVFSGTITGSGDLIKDGTGLWLFTGSFDTTGILSIDNGTVEIAAAFSGNVDFSANSHGFLILDQPMSFAGIVSGLTTGDYIDLTNIDFADHPTIQYLSKTHQLTVTDPHTKVSDTITLDGDYKRSDFVLSSDGSHGTLLAVQTSQHGNHNGNNGGVAPVTNSVTISSSAQHDTFVFAPNFGQNTINNFNAHNDTIQPHTELPNFGAVLVDASEIDVVPQSDVTLHNQHSSDLLLV
jgi:autotransporter-associated beta strand protein